MIQRYLILNTLLLLFHHLLQTAESYPLLVELNKKEVQCFHLQIPDDDDAHLVLLAMKSDIPDTLEEWFFKEVSEISRPNSLQFLKDLSSIPETLSQQLKSASSKQPRGRVRAKLEHSGGGSYTKPINLNFYKISVHPHIAKEQNDASWDPDYGGFHICLENDTNSEIHVLFNYVIVSEVSATLSKHHVVKKEHLSVLERNFAKSVKLTKTILDEMEYMERREARMKHTTDHTNRRVKYFSFVSISILVGVTYVQVTYLKSYFRKKKIL